jgi:hypothetical protein
MKEFKGAFGSEPFFNGSAPGPIDVSMCVLVSDVCFQAKLVAKSLDR